MRLAPMGLLALLITSGCSEQLVPPEVEATLLNQGAVYPGHTVQLDGTATTDPNELALDYRWDFVAAPFGSVVRFNDPKLARTSFVPDLAGTYGVVLTATNGVLAASTEPLAIEVAPCADTEISIAEVLADPVAAQPGDVVELSVGVEGASNCLLEDYVRYEWWFHAKPPGSQSELNDTGLLNPSFTADQQGTYVVRVVASDGLGRTSSPGEVEVVTGDCGLYQPVVSDVALSDDEPDTGEQVVLTPVVTDADNDEPCLLDQQLSYRWELVSVPAGSTTTLGNTTVMEPWLTPDLPGTYVVRLVVTDSAGLRSAPYVVDIDVDVCGSFAPVVQWVTADPAAPGVGDIVGLSAMVTDEDVTACELEQEFSYAWSLASLPVGSAAKLNDGRIEAPTLVPDISGFYGVELVVTDDTRRASEAFRFDLLVTDCGEHAPVATIVPPDPVDVGEAALFGATVTDTDNDSADDGGCELEQTFDYSWSILTQPAGSAASFNDPRSSAPSLVPDVAGTYRVQLVVVDSAGLPSAAATVDYEVGDCGIAAPVATIDEVPEDTYDVFDDIPLTAEVDDADNDEECDLGQTFSYAWAVVSQPVGARAVLGNPASSDPTLIGDVSGTYTVRLVVTDSAGLASEADFADVDVGDCGETAPDVDIDPITGSWDVGDSIDLSAVVTDPDDACMEPDKDYAWSLVTVPVGSSAVVYNATTEAPTLVPDLPGDYTVGLRVTDAMGLSTWDEEVVASIGSCGLHPPVVADLFYETEGNRPPEQINTLQWAELSADVSDADNESDCGSLDQALFYSWSIVDQPLGSSPEFDSPTTPTPGFFTDLPGTYEIALRVRDETGEWDQLSEVVDVDACGSFAPVARIELLAPVEDGPDTSVSAEGVPPGTGVRLNAAASTDPDDDSATCDPARDDDLVYEWRFVRQPAGSEVELSGEDTVEATFVPDQPGTYEVELLVGDGDHWSEAATAVVDADLSASIGSPVGAEVSFLAGGEGYGFDQPTGVVAIGSDVYVVNAGNDTLLRVDSSGTVHLVATGVYLNQPQHLVYDEVYGHLYVLNGGDDFVIQVDPDDGSQVLYVDETPLAEDLDTVVLDDTPYVCVVGRFLDQVDCYLLSDAALASPTDSWDFDGDLDESYAVEIAEISDVAHVWAQSQEGGTGGNLRHTTATDPDVSDLYLDGAFEASFLGDLSYEATSDRLFYTVTGVDYVGRMSNCGHDECFTEVWASGFDEIGGIFAVDAVDLLVTDQGADAVYLISL